LAREGWPAALSIVWKTLKDPRRVEIPERDREGDYVTISSRLDSPIVERPYREIARSQIGTRKGAHSREEKARELATRAMSKRVATFALLHCLAIMSPFIITPFPRPSPPPPPPSRSLGMGPAFRADWHPAGPYRVIILGGPRARLSRECSSGAATRAKNLILSFARRGVFYIRSVRRDFHWRKGRSSSKVLSSSSSVYILSLMYYNDILIFYISLCCFVRGLLLVFYSISNGEYLIIIRIYFGLDKYSFYIVLLRV